MKVTLEWAKQHTVFLLIGLTFLLYIPTFFGDFLWDDEDFVYANSYVKGFSVTDFFTKSVTSGRYKTSNYYRPLQLITYAIEYKMVGASPWLFHVSNVLWHIAAGVMVYLVLQRICITWALAFGAALIFLLHPIQTEAVSYISGRSDMMFVFFILLSFLLQQKKGKRSALLSIIFFICGLLSKESALIAFAVFPILSFIQYGFSREYTRAIKRYIPHLIIGLIYVVIRFTVLEFASTTQTWGTSIYTTSLLVRLATFFRNYFFYWQALLLPVDLHMERDESTLRIITSIASKWMVLFVMAQSCLIGSILWLYKKSKIYGRIALGSYLGIHAIMGFYSGLILLNGIFYEHYVYSALPFFILLFGSYIAVAKSYIRNAAYILIGIWFVVFGVFYNIKRQIIWADPILFFTNTVQHAPESVRIINSLGMAYAQKGDYNTALQVYNRGIAIDSKIPNFYHNKGMVFMSQKKYKQAERSFLYALEVEPTFYFSINQLLVLAHMYDTDQHNTELAVSLYTRILPFVSTSTDLHTYITNQINELKQRENEKTN